MQYDERGLALTTENAEAVRLFDETLRNNLESRKGTAQSIKSALAADPEFFMGNCLKGYLFYLFGDWSYNDRIESAIAVCEPMLDLVTPREASHLAILRAFLKGDQRQAATRLKGILSEFPTDLLALRLQHFNNFYMGERSDLRDDVAAVLPHWQEDTPGYGFLLGMRAFGLEECGDYAAAEVAGRAAVERNPDDLWAIHAVAHVLEMQGRHREGLDWISQPQEAWEDRNAFTGHLWWHRSLYALELGQIDHVLSLYDTAIRGDTDSTFYLDLENAVALLWRLEFLGVDVGDRWQELAETCAGRIGDHTLVFSSIHFLMGLNGGQRDEDAARQLASLEELLKTPENYGATTLEAACLPLAHGFIAFTQGRYEDAERHLAQAHGETQCLGGSRAQQDVFELFLIEAAQRAGQGAHAQGLLAARVAAKPHAATAWQKYAAVLSEQGDDAGAAQARQKIEALRA